jgi:hypothetical protein
MLLAFLGFLPVCGSRAGGEEPIQPALLYSGKALNKVLPKFNRLPASPEPPPALTARAKRAVNLVTPSGVDASVFLKAKALGWPEAFDDAKKQTGQFIAAAAEVVRQAKKGKVAEKTAGELTAAARALRKHLEDKVNDFSPSQYIAAHRLTRRLEVAVKSASRANLGAELDLVERAAKISGAVELARFLNEKKLTFAAAFPGDEAGYQELYKAFVKHLASAKPSRK